MGEERYVTLMASLPYHGRLFGARQTPLSRFQLNKRLAWLEPHDAESLAQMEGVLRWGKNLLLETDADYIGKAKSVIENLQNPLLAGIVTTRLEMRTLVAAMRMRSVGRSAPREGESWGFGRWVNLMRQHWNDPDFGVGHMFPWVAEAQRTLQEGNTLGLERLFMGHAWQHLARSGAGHYFDFEAVTVYVLRWDLIDRWTRYEEQAAQRTIVGLAETGLGNYRQMYH